MSKKIPSLSWRDSLAMRGDEPSRLLYAANHFEDLVQVRTYPPVIALTHPEAIEQVLIKKRDNFSKEGVIQYRRMGRLLGNGLLTNTDPSWLERRRLLQPNFHAAQWPALTAITQRLTQAMLDRWEWQAKHQQPLNIVPEFLALMIQISIRFLFSEELSISAANSLVKDFTVAQRAFCGALFLHPHSPSPLSILFYRKRKKIEKMVRQIIARREACAEAAWPDDMLSQLLKAERAKILSAEEVIDEVITFVVTGHETTGSFMNWAWLCLGRNSESYVQLQKEIDQVLGGRLPEYADLEKLTYTRLVFMETLRLYPTIWATARRSLENDNIHGYNLAKKSIVVICPYAMHRSARYWQEPEQFMPERFAKLSSPAELRQIYFPFGLGPRTCIANNFSLIKGQLILAMVAQRFHLELLPESEEIPVEALISLRPKKAIRFLLTKKD